MSPPWKSSDVWASCRNLSQHSFLAWDKERNMSLDVTSLDWPLSFFRRFSAPKCRWINKEIKGIITVLLDFEISPGSCVLCGPFAVKDCGNAELIQTAIMMGRDQQQPGAERPYQRGSTKNCSFSTGHLRLAPKATQFPEEPMLMPNFIAEINVITAS